MFMQCWALAVNSACKWECSAHYSVLQTQLSKTTETGRLLTRSLFCGVCLPFGSRAAGARDKSFSRSSERCKEQVEEDPCRLWVGLAARPCQICSMVSKQLSVLYFRPTDTQERKSKFPPPTGKRDNSWYI